MAHEGTIPQYASSGVRKQQKIDDDQIEELKEAFQIFDTEHQGKIDHREFKAALRALGYEINRDDVEK